MVDCPRYNPVLRKKLEEFGGLKYIFLTHQARSLFVVSAENWWLQRTCTCLAISSHDSVFQEMTMRSPAGMRGNLTE